MARNSNYTIETRLDDWTIAKEKKVVTGDISLIDIATAKLEMLRAKFPHLNWSVRVTYLRDYKWEEVMWSSKEVAEQLSKKIAEREERRLASANS